MSKGYKFKLEKLLELRTEKEEESKRLFSESKNKKILVENQLIDLKNKYDSYKGIKPGEDVVYQKIKRRYLFALQDGIKQKEKELVLKEKEVEFRTKDLNKKMIDRKTVEILKEKQQRNFYKEQERIEQINADELALYAYMRTLKGGE